MLEMQIPSTSLHFYLFKMNIPNLELLAVVEDSALGGELALNY